MRIIFREPIMKRPVFRPELLEDRICPSTIYDYTVIAQSGQNGLASITQFPSINDNGQVAFIASLDAGGEGIFVGNGSSFPTNVTQLVDPNRTYLASVQINNAGQVVAAEREFSPNFRRLQLWDVNNPGTYQSLAGSGVNGTSIFSYATLNNAGNTVFAAIPSAGSNVVLSAPTPPLGFGTQFYTLPSGPQPNIRPMLADDGTVVFRAGNTVTSSILARPSTGGYSATIASAANFQTLGNAPGIGNDGRFVAFYGDLTAIGAATLTTAQPVTFAPLTPGPGVFVRMVVGGFPVVQRVAGVSGNGYLDPGETISDLNGNGSVDLGEDSGPFSAFEPDARVGVNATWDGTGPGFVTVVFAGTSTTAVSGIYTARVTIDPVAAALPAPNPPPRAVDVTEVGKVLQVGDLLPGGEVVTAVNLFDPVNNKGQVAVWAGTAAGAAVVRADPIRKPVLIVPGIVGSYSAALTEDLPWLLARGAPPNRLAVDPLGAVYNAMIKTFENAGYVRGKDLFIAVYDWRLPNGPRDGTADGHLAGLTAAGITDTVYQYGVDYLGYWLKEAAFWWEIYHPGLPALESVDVVAHSMGGLVTRAYIQSDAYGGEYTPGQRLPTIDQFITVGTPHQGASKPWNVVRDDWDADPSYQFVLSKILNRVYRQVVDKGRIVFGPTPITLASITGSTGQPDPVKFIEQYVPSLRDLLGIYDFGLGTLPAEQQNSFLLDLNASFDPNAFANEVDDTTVIYGSGVDTFQTVRPRTQSAADPAGRVLLPFADLFANEPAPNQTWFEDVLGERGDGTVPLISARDQFVGDGRVNLREVAEATHTGLMSNLTAQKIILNQLGLSLSESQIVTSASPGFGILLPPVVVRGMWSVFSDPVEVVLTDSQGRRLGWTAATGSLAEIPDSLWLGGADGMGWVFGPVEGQPLVRLSGLGESYYVQVSGLQGGYEFGGEAAGTLANGATTPVTLTSQPVYVAPTAPVVTTNPANQVANAGNHISLTAAAVGSPSPSVRWQVSADGGTTFADVPGATSTTYSATVTESAAYRAVFTNANGSAASTAAFVTLAAAPSNVVIGGPEAQFPQVQLAQPTAQISGFFYPQATLANGNIVMSDFGSVYLFDGKTGNLISTLTGLGTSISVTPLTNGNFVIVSPDSALNGTVTWANGVTGINGTVSASNSLVGISQGGIPPTYDMITPLPNGNYIISNPSWRDRRGFVTWANGWGGTVGGITAANSLVGESPGDLVGTAAGGGGDGVVPLANGNYVVASGFWGDRRGAVIWGNGLTGVVGTYSPTNSLVGSNPNDNVGLYGVEALPNGNYLVKSPQWNGARGALTWGSGTSGVIGEVSEANSLVGTNANELIGFALVQLVNGNYVTYSPYWGGYAGAVTWGNGLTGIAGEVTIANSLIGDPANVGEQQVVGFDGSVVALTNGNYVVSSPSWGSYLGAITWGSGTTGLTGNITVSNSIVGNTSWGGGSNTGDHVGSGGITPLANGNYVVLSPDWGAGRSAVTWASGTMPSSFTISSTNSLIGTDTTDRLGSAGIVALTNGNYVVASPHWEFDRGAATWGSGTTGISGTVSATNSLVGEAPRADKVAFRGVTPLSNGNYVVNSPEWNGGRGAVSWGDGTVGTWGVVLATNSLVGTQTSDHVGGGVGTDPYGRPAPGGGVTALQNGNYVILSPFWSDASGIGAATWGNGAGGVVGPVSTSNSLVHFPRIDIGRGYVSVEELPNGDYYVMSLPGFYGASATWVSGTNGSTVDGESTITPQNTLGSVGNSFVGGAIGITSIGTGEKAISLINAYPSLYTRIGFTDPNDLTYAWGQGQTVAFTPAFITNALAAGIDVTIESNNDLILNDPLLVNPLGTPGRLTLKAGRSIILNANIDTGGGGLTLIANTSLADGVIDGLRDPGNASITAATGVGIYTGGGLLIVDLQTGTEKTNNGVGVVSLPLVSAGDVVLSPATTLGINIGGTTAGDGVVAGTYTQFNVAGSLDLNGAKLSVTHSAVTPAGTVFTIMQATGGITGTFNGLSEGSTVAAPDGTTFTIRYQGTGITLTQNAVVVLTPTVTSLSPSSGSISGGTTVTVNGTNLATATAIFFGSTPGTIVSATTTQITVISPSGLAGVVNVTVATLSGTSAISAASQYTYVTVLPPNSPPTARDDNAIVAVGSANNAISVLGNDTDPDGDPLSVSAAGPATHGTVSVVAGVVRYTPLTGFAGNDSFVYSISDGRGGNAQATVIMTITNTPPVNTPPTISQVSDRMILAGASTGAIAFTIGDAETAASGLTVTATTSNSTLLTSVLLGGAGANRTVTVTTANGRSGSISVTLTVRDPQGAQATSTFTVVVQLSPSTSTPALVGYPQFAVGADRGGSPSVRFFNPDGSVRFSTAAFDASVTGGVRTAAADFNGDGVADVVIGTGPGGPTLVRVLDGRDGDELFRVAPFEAAFIGGVYVAADDLSGDGVPELVITPDEGGGPRVQVYRGNDYAKIADFFGIDDANFRGGARAAVGDVTGDGAGDLVISAGFGGGPRISVYDGRSLTVNGLIVHPVGDFFLFEQALRNGAFVAVGDLNGDGFADIIGGGGPGGGPRVYAVSGRDLLAGREVPLANFFAGNTNNRGGIRVSVKDLDGDAHADILVGDGTAAGSRVTAYLGKDFNGAGAPEAFGFDAYPGFTGGVFVG